MRFRLVFLFLVFANAGQVPSARAWGEEGHTVSVTLALRLMDSSQRAKVYALLGTHSPDYIGNWADRYGGKINQPWHYVDIPASDARYKPSDCGNACVISQLEWAKAYISDHRHSKSSRRKALLWWFHLTADLHQPFHCYDNNDRGGNETFVRFQNDRMSLHHLWDSGILDAMQPNADRLERIIYKRFGDTPAPPESFIDAANRSHKHAIEAAKIHGMTITSGYLEREWPVLLQSLWESACMAAEIAPVI